MRAGTAARPHGRTGFAWRRFSRAAVLLCGCALLLASPLAAQDTTRVTRDSARADSARAVPDSLNPDSLRPPLPRLGAPPGPLPAGRRRVFTRDDLDWLGARSLGELLAFVPGAFLVRPGWFGLPERIAYAGQGAASVELYLDGYLLTPLGEDTTSLDLSRYDIGLMHRVEVEVWPTVLRVYLVSDVGTVRRPRTEASFATGDAETNTYRGRYLNRWTDGSGFGVAASYFATNGPGTSPADVNDLLIWLKGTWTPSPLVGVEYTMLSAHKERDALRNGTSDSIPSYNATRRDAFVRAFAATRADGMGLRFDALFGSSHEGDSSGTIDEDHSQAVAAASWRAATWALAATTRFTGGSTRFLGEVRGSWAPTRFATVTAHARTTRRLGRSRDVELSASGDLRVLPWVAAFGAFRWRDQVTDTAQTAGDWEAGLALRSGRADVAVSAQRHAALRAPVFGVFRSQIPHATAIDVVTLTVAYHLRPTAYLTLSGWYRHPLDPVQAAFEPPHHSRTALTFRSRFLPRFRRGFFDVLVQAEVEAWGDGVAGRDSNDVAVRLEGAGTLSYLVEFRLVGAVLFWTFRNAQYEHYNVVPGYPMARGLQRFGIRWEFTN